MLSPAMKRIEATQKEIEVLLQHLKDLNKNVEHNIELLKETIENGRQR